MDGRIHRGIQTEDQTTTRPRKQMIRLFRILHLQKNPFEMDSCKKSLQQSP
jgi:hypothetical protein